MFYLKKFKFPFLIILCSAFIVLMARAATPYMVTLVHLDESEFPRLQTTLKIEGETEGLLPKNLQLIENGRVNLGPMALLPPENLPEAIDLRVIIDTSSNSKPYQKLIVNNLKGLVKYLIDQNVDLKVQLSTFQNSHQFESIAIEEISVFLDQLKFEEVPISKASFENIIAVSQGQGRPKAQQIMLILNSSAFQDIKPDGATGLKMQNAIATAQKNNDLIFVLGHPVQQMHNVRAEGPTAELIDFSHQVRGGYLGGFGTDLTSLGKLLLKQSVDHFVLQYYTSHPPSKFFNASTGLLIDGVLAHEFSYKKPINSDLILHHLPENELSTGDSAALEVDLEPNSKAISTVQLNYKNEKGIFDSIPFLHDRISSSQEKFKYFLRLPEAIFSKDYFTYFISVHTPYSSTGGETGVSTIPVNFYDDGIFLEAKLSQDKKSVDWSWSGPTVEKGKTFEVWSGDMLLTTTSQTHYSIPLEMCNRYQILQVKVIFKDQTKSHPSRPVEFFADSAKDQIVKEKEGVELMLQCLEDKKIQTYLEWTVGNSEFSPQSPLTLEKAGLYLAKLVHEDIWKNIKTGSDYYELLLYIMKFLNKEQYLKYGLESQPLNKSLIYKFITIANHTAEIQKTFNEGLKELSARIRGSVTF